MIKTMQYVKTDIQFSSRKLM